MYVRGSASTTRRPASRPSSTSAFALVLGEPATAGPRRQQLDDAGPDVVPGVGVAPGRDCRARPPAQAGPARRHRSVLGVGGVRGGAASSTTPAPSVSIAPRPAPAVGAATTLTTRISASVRSVVPSGSATSEAWIWVPAVRPSTETSICSGMLETSASTSIVFSSWVTRVSGAGLAGDDDLHLDDDLLAAADHQQVDVLDVGADRVRHHGLGERELRRAADVEREHGVAALLADDPGELQRGQRQVLRVGAVPVEHGGDLAGAAGAAGGALAELRAGLGVDTGLGHGGSPRSACCVEARATRQTGRGRACVDHGGLSRAPALAAKPSVSLRHAVRRPAAGRTGATPGLFGREVGEGAHLPALHRASVRRRPRSIAQQVLVIERSGVAVEEAGDRAVFEHLVDRLGPAAGRWAAPSCAGSASRPGSAACR